MHAGNNETKKDVRTATHHVSHEGWDCTVSTTSPEGGCALPKLN